MALRSDGASNHGSRCEDHVPPNTGGHVPPNTGGHVPPNTGGHVPPNTGGPVPAGPADRAACRRGQSNVIGVALLLGITVVALGALTATIGAVIGSHAASADAARVADGLAGSLDPVEATGRHRGRIAFTEGSLRTVERDLRVLDASGVRHTVAVDALVFEAEGHRVAFAAGAVVRGRAAGADFLEAPPVTASRGPGGVLIVGAPRLGGTADVAGSGGVTVTLRTDVQHNRTDLGRGRYGIAVETTTPAPWAAYFRRQDATVSRRDYDADGLTSVVARYSGQRHGYLVVHDLDLEVVP